MLHALARLELLRLDGKEAIEKKSVNVAAMNSRWAQGGYGIENELEQDEIDAADVVLLAIAIGIEGDERFDEAR